MREGKLLRLPEIMFIPLWNWEGWEYDGTF